ncbi:MAG: ABC transporter ATP-binding protein [Vicinamibacterales bacterium]
MRVTYGSDLPPGQLLRVSALTKRYGRFTALSDVSFHVRQGEVLGLIGPNGSGKTTLFECLGGLLPFEGGEIADAARHSVFFVPDAVAPWPAQPVDWVLRYIAGLFGGADGARDRVVRALEIDPLLRVPMGQLSKGQRKRVLLALGLLTPHAMLLADEPFEGLDLRQTREVARVLREVSAGGRTLFLSIHQIADAARVCDRFVLLSGGRVRGEGTLAELGVLAASKGGGVTADLEEVFLALT